MRNVRRLPAPRKGLARISLQLGVFDGALAHVSVTVPSQEYSYGLTFLPAPPAPPGSTRATTARYARGTRRRSHAPCAPSRRAQRIACSVEAGRSAPGFRFAHRGYACSLSRVDL